MARPLKDGVDYFPKDTSFYNDDKVRLLRGEFGVMGMYVLDYLLCEIYGKNGYFLPWDSNKPILIAEAAGAKLTHNDISEVVSGCIRRSIFDKRVFDMFGVLTSAGIQRRYIRMFNGRDEISIIEEYWLLDCSSKKDVPYSILNKLAFKSLKSKENPDKSKENPDKTTGNPQSKRNKNKINKNTMHGVNSSTFDAEEFDDPRGYTVPDLSKRKVK